MQLIRRHVLHTLTTGECASMVEGEILLNENNVRYDDINGQTKCSTTLLNNIEVMEIHYASECSKGNSLHQEHLVRRRYCSLSPIYRIQHRMNQKIAVKIIIFIILLVMMGLIIQLPMEKYILNTSIWIQDHPTSGPFIAVLAMCIAIPLWVPATILEVLAGTLFGTLVGIIVIIFGKTGGCLVAFAQGRYLGKETIGQYLTTHFATFWALSTVLTCESWRPLLIFQVSSLPNLLKCYGLSVTNISVWRFTVSSVVGNIPYAILMSYIGAQAKDIRALLSGSTPWTAENTFVLVVGMIATVISMVYLVSYTKRQLDELRIENANCEDNLTASISSGECDELNSIYHHSQVNCINNNVSCRIDIIPHTDNDVIISV